MKQQLEPHFILSFHAEPVKFFSKNKIKLYQYFLHLIAKALFCKIKNATLNYIDAAKLKFQPKYTPSQLILRLNQKSQNHSYRSHSLDSHNDWYWKTHRAEYKAPWSAGLCNLLDVGGAQAAFCRRTEIRRTRRGRLVPGCKRRANEFAHCSIMQQQTLSGARRQLTGAAARRILDRLTRVSAREAAHWRHTSFSHRERGPGERRCIIWIEPSCICHVCPHTYANDVFACARVKFSEPHSEQHLHYHTQTRI